MNNFKLTFGPSMPRCNMNLISKPIFSIKVKRMFNTFISRAVMNKQWSTIYHCDLILGFTPILNKSITLLFSLIRCSLVKLEVKSFGIKIILKNLFEVRWKTKFYDIHHLCFILAASFGNFWIRKHLVKPITISIGRSKKKKNTTYSFQCLQNLCLHYLSIWWQCKVLLFHYKNTIISRFRKGCLVFQLG